jgi:hypothetical protein
MGAVKQQFIEDNKGRRIAVLLPIDQYNEMLEQLEEMDDIKAYDAAKAEEDEVIPFDQAIEEIEAKRNDLKVHLSFIYDFKIVLFIIPGSHICVSFLDSCDFLFIFIGLVI